MDADGDGDDELEAQIKAQVDEWSSNSNDSFTIQLVDGHGAPTASFHPEFTYPIFGDEEAIFGYKDLAITLTFAAHNLRPHLAIQYSSAFEAQGEVRPTNISEALKDFLPASAFTEASRDETLHDTTAGPWHPPGQEVHGYSREGERFEIWCASLEDASAKLLLENMQILVPMFIEGGTALQLEQDWTTQRWKLFLLYRVAPHDGASASSRYSLVGYGTSYRVFSLPDRHNLQQSDTDLLAQDTQSLDSFLPPPSNNNPPSSASTHLVSPLDLPSRERLSQFLILPPHQGSGHGQELYHTMYKHLTAPSNVREFTVEDPNEAFDDLRDLCDLLYLRQRSPEFTALRIHTNVPAEKLKSDRPIPTDLIVPADVRERVMRQTKIMPRQFDRLVEMHTLSFIPPLHRSRTRITRKEKSSSEHDRAYYFWRLYAKQRLYIFNRDPLIQLDRAERAEKLEAALDSVQEGYVKMLEKVEARESRAVNGNGGGVAEETIVSRPRKRKVLEEEDDDDEEEEEEGGGGDGGDGEEDGLDKGGSTVKGVLTNGSKKARVK